MKSSRCKECNVELDDSNRFIQHSYGFIKGTNYCNTCGERRFKNHRRTLKRREFKRKMGERW